MAKDPGFVFYPGDYLRDTQCLSERVQVAYDRILCEHMRNICISQKQLDFFTKRLTNEEKDELMMTLKVVECGFQIEWVAESISKRRAYSESRRNNRTKKDNNISKTYVTHMDNENEDENAIGFDNNKRSAKGKLPPPTLPEVTEFFQIKGYSPELAQKAFEYYQAANWHDMNGNPVRNWKQKMIANWLKPQNKTNGNNHNQQPAPATTGDRIGRVSKRALAELKRTTIDMLKGSHGNSGDMHPDIIPVPG